MSNSRLSFLATPPVRCVFGLVALLWLGLLAPNFQAGAATDAPATVPVKSPPAATVSPAPLNYTSTWIGNSYGQGDGRWVQNNILGLYLAPNGLLYTNSWWDEGRRESGFYSSTDGTPVGMLASLHDSFGGGFAVTGDDSFIYASNWDAVRRCHFDGRPAPFDGGHGVNGDSIGVSTKPTGTDKSIGVRGLAIDKAHHLLFISENNDNELEVWDTATMTFLRKWAVERPGAVAVGDDGLVWLVARKGAGQDAQIRHYAPDGTRLEQTLTSGAGFDPNSLWFDARTGRLLVADDGPDQNIKIYSDLSQSRTKPDASFGASIYSGKSGEVTATKFGSSGLTGVATDAAGNYYVSMNGVGPVSFWHGGGTVLESWTPAGKLRWRKVGLDFVDSADADATSDAGSKLDVYDKYSHYRLDLSRTTAGTEWSYVGRTLNQFKYPADQRYTRSMDGWDYTGGTFVRNVRGHKLLYVLSMQARRVLIFRFNPATDGETAIPAGVWESQAGYNADYPDSPRGKDFFWRDKNGDGKIESSEFVAGPGMPNRGFGMWVDSNGDFWSCNHWAQSGVGIRRWKMQGFDAHGNPIYDYSPGNYTEFQRPDGGQGELRRLEYFPETDTMYVSSTNITDGDRDAGNRFVKYTNWSTPARKTAWILDPPMEGTKISAMTVAGDYLFLGYSFFGSNSREGTIRVYKTSDGSFAGEITPTPAVGSVSGTFDIPYAIRAFKRHSGEYLIFAEDDHFAKVIVHRWNPANRNAPLIDTLDQLDLINHALSSAGWRIDGSNPTQFNRDTGRATRIEDASQWLVWDVPHLSDFAAAVYHDPKIDLATTVSFAVSADGKTWTPVRASSSPPQESGGGWKISMMRPATAIPANTRFLKLQIAPTGTSWNVQVGRMELFTATATP